MVDKDPFADAILKALDGKSKATRQPGYYRGMDGNRAIVDFGDGRVPADMAMDTIPQVNDPVWILVIEGEQPLILGLAVPRPGNGTVTNIGSGVATVSTLFGDVTAPYGYTVTVGDLVKLLWNEGPFIVGPQSTPSVAPVDPGKPSGGGGEKMQTFYATESGSFRGRWWTPQVRAGDTNQGVWTYGTKIPGTISAGATIVSVEIYISPIRIAGSAPNFAVHGYPTLAGVGAPGFGPQAAVGVHGGWVPLPVAFGNFLKAGGGYNGVGVNHGGDNIFNAVSADGLSGALRIRYRT